MNRPIVPGGQSRQAFKTLREKRRGALWGAEPLGGQANQACPANAECSTSRLDGATRTGSRPQSGHSVHWCAHSRACRPS